MADEGLNGAQVLCFACSAAGARSFSLADAGLIVAATHDLVWHISKDASLEAPGADVAAPECPTARQLAWLHEVFTQKLWCTCLWLCPPPGELRNTAGVPSDCPSAADRAEMTTVSSGSISAWGHPPWASPVRRSDGQTPCTAKLGSAMLPCPDWTPMDARCRGRGAIRELIAFPKVVLYCHSLDVGVAKVNHMFEAADHNGLRIRVSSKRLVSLSRAGQAASELSVTVLECSQRYCPDVCIRSSIRYDIPEGFSLRSPKVQILETGAVLVASLIDEETGRTLTVTAVHRLVEDDGHGDVQLTPGPPEFGCRAYIETAGPTWGSVSKDACAIDVVFLNPRRGTRYTVEKVIQISGSLGKFAPQERQNSLRRLSSFATRQRTTAEIPSLSQVVPEKSPLLRELEEEHRSAWQTEWDKADIEIVGTRKATRCQRAARLFRYHEVSREDPAVRKKSQVPQLVGDLFEAFMSDLCEAKGFTRPSSLVMSRVLVQDPRNPPVVRIEPRVPPDCRLLRFNEALGWRWHRFTLTPGRVQILVQGPILSNTQVQLHGETVQQPPKFIVSSMAFDEGVEIRAAPWHEVQVQHALTDLGRPDGSSGGFYGLMRRTRFMRLEVVRRLFAEDGDAENHRLDYRDETLTQPLRNALAALKSAPRPPGWRKGDNQDLHILEADATTRTRMHLAYEKNELFRDITFLEGKFIEVKGQLPGEDLSVDTMTLQQAKTHCAQLLACRGFTFQGESTDDKAMKIHFRGRSPEGPSLEDPGTAGAQLCSQRSSSLGWTSFEWKDGESALIDLFCSQHDARFRSEGSRLPWVKAAVPSLEALAREVIAVLEPMSCVAGREGESNTTSPSCAEQRKPFRNFITDRDGTISSYCDRYASSVQSAYNAAWLTHFARHCADNSIIVTAAPLGGRPSAEGLMELCVAPRGYFTYSGSKGREYFDDTSQQMLEAEELPKEHRELIEELHRRILLLSSQPGNTKFLGIGSGLQRKFGEVTMARNDMAGTVPDPESRRFMAAVRRVKEELDPDGTALDFHDTGTDMEMFPRTSGKGRVTSFDKGNGVRCLDEKLQLRIADGPNIVCGDTVSDLPMVITALRIMCGDKMVDKWEERVRREVDDIPSEESQPLSRSFDGEEQLMELSFEEVEQRARDEAERKAKEEDEERIAREAGSKLAVLFVITPEQHSKTPKLADYVSRWCELCGGFCVILPSPDALVFALASFANISARRAVTGAPVLSRSSTHGIRLSTPKAKVSPSPSLALDLMEADV